MSQDNGCRRHGVADREDDDSPARRRGVAAAARPGAGGVVHSRRPARARSGRRAVARLDPREVRADRRGVPRRSESRLRRRGAHLHHRGPRHRRARRVARAGLGRRQGERRRGDGAGRRRQLHGERAARDLRQCRRRACGARAAGRVFRQPGETFSRAANGGDAAGWRRIAFRAGRRNGCATITGGNTTRTHHRNGAQRHEPAVAGVPVMAARSRRQRRETKMSKLQVSDMLARAFAAEGVEVLFTLMGDANMYWSVAMSKLPGMEIVHARHEHCAVAMADGYARATGKVGVASTTCGPGFTQIMTALTIAARGNVPLVVFAGDSPLAASWYLQQIDMAPLALACGAHYVGVKHIDRLLDNVREAFQVAQAEQRPVVLSVPMDMQKQAWPHLTDYTPSSELVPMAQRPIPDPVIVDRVIDMIAEAEKPNVLASRGAILSGAAPALEALAEQTGALIATWLRGKGLFDGNRYALDIAGAFASDFSRERFAEADLVIGVGAALGHYTTEGGYLYPTARTVQIDTNPRGLWQGLRTADLHVRADAKAAAEAIVARMKQRGVSRAGFRSADMAQQIAGDQPDSKEF